MGLWSWLRGVSEPDTGRTSAPALPSGETPSGRDAADPPSDPGWRALPPVQRTLAGGVHPVARLGTIEDIHAGIIENMFATDVAFLQDLYRRVNQEGHTRAGVTCPSCQHSFAVDVAGSRLGES